MMHLGLNESGGVYPEDWRCIDDLGVTYIKVARDILPSWQASADVLCQWAETHALHGCHTIVDVRIEVEEIHNLYRDTAELLFPAAQVRGEEPDEDHIRERLLTSWNATMETVGDRLRPVIAQCKDLIQDWEIQGEFKCPAVSRGAFSDYDYTLHLAVCHEAIKDVDSGARVWLGGSGVALGAEWIEDLIVPYAGATPSWFPHGVGHRFDVTNWHHYGHTVKEDQDSLGLAAQIAAYDESFDRARYLLKAYGADQPFASTEWGLPVVPDAKLIEPGGFRYKSAIYGGGVYAIPESLVGEWYEGCLACFEKHGFKVLCIHHLHDLTGTQRQTGHWGAFCGLLDDDNKPRDSYFVVRRYAQAARASGEAAFG